MSSALHLANQVRRIAAVTKQYPRRWAWSRKRSRQRRKRAKVVASLLLLLVLIGCRKTGLAPICGTERHGSYQLYECWYYCDANWHPDVSGIPTIRDASGRVLHWRGAP